MTNSEHLNWIIDRLVSVHNENPNYDYMIRFRDIINKIEKEENKDNLTEQEKISFILKTESKIMVAIMKGHKASDCDVFSEDRKLMNKYRKQLGLI